MTGVQTCALPISCAIENLSARRFDEYLSLGQVPHPGEQAANDAALANPVPPRDEVYGELGDPELAASPIAHDDPNIDPEMIDAEPMPAAEEPGADTDDIAIVRGTLRAPWKWEELIVESAVIAGRDRADSQQTPCRYLHQNPPKGDCRPTRVNHALPPQGGQHFISLIFVRLPGSQQDSFGAGVAP